MLVKVKEVIKVNVDILKLQIGIDGLPLFKSSAGEFWPILCSISNVEKLKSLILPIGIFYGKKKPTSCASFLEEFLKEAIELTRNGLLEKGTIIKVKIEALICDAPAKSFILGIKGHTGYSSCTIWHNLLGIWQTC
uniref:Uncharacterized protein n=1 Tax=Cacopsylla melanoneura TaxID=428564 RepID=A0A8D8VVU2_9HEMI